MKTDRTAPIRCSSIRCRIQAIADARAIPGKVDLSNGKFFAGTGNVGDAVASSLRQWATRRAKAEAEIENARDRARAMQNRAVPPGDTAPAVTPAEPRPGPKKADRLGGGDAGAAHA